MSGPLLSLRGVSVHAGGREILGLNSLDLAPGETMGVIGPNGAGKSTLLRVAGALIRPERGEVLLDGRPVARAELRRVTAAVLQRPVLRRGSVRANVQTGMRFHRLPRPVIAERTDAWLERLGITAYAGRSAQSLSGGEAQRVSLARALAVAPRLLLLDEPFAALDAPTRGELLADLRAALDETGTAALLVSHDRDEVAALSHSIAVLHEGRLRQHGPAGHVLEHPADRDCARTLGFDTIAGRGLAERLLGRDPGAEVALRAGDCEVLPAPGEAGVAARLRRVVPLGPSSRVLVGVGDGDGGAGGDVQASAPMPLPEWLAAKAPGDPVWVRVRADAARVLGDPGNGRP